VILWAGGVVSFSAKVGRGNRWIRWLLVEWRIDIDVEKRNQEHSPRNRDVIPSFAFGGWG